MDKELAGWPHQKGCSQWLNVQMETSNKWCVSGVSMGTGSVSRLCWWQGQWDWVNLQPVWGWHQAEWCRWFASEKECHLEGHWQAWVVVPVRISRSSVRSSAISCTDVEAILSINTDWGMNGLRAVFREGLGDIGWWKVGQEPAIRTCSPESQLYPGLQLNKCGQ